MDKQSKITIVTLNVNGLNNDGKKSAIFQNLSTMKPSIIGLTDTRLSDENQELFQARGGRILRLTNNSVELWKKVEVERTNYCFRRSRRDFEYPPPFWPVLVGLTLIRTV